MKRTAWLSLGVVLAALGACSDPAAETKEEPAIGGAGGAQNPVVATVVGVGGGGASNGAQTAFEHVFTATFGANTGAEDIVVTSDGRITFTGDADKSNNPQTFGDTVVREHYVVQTDDAGPASVPRRASSLSVAWWRRSP